MGDPEVLEDVLPRAGAEFDQRTRCDSAIGEFEPRTFFEQTLPCAFADHAERLESAAWLRLGSFGFETPAGSWILKCELGRFRVDRGCATGPMVRLNVSQLAELVNDQTTPIAIMLGGFLEMPRGSVADFLDWWLVLRAALDGRSVFVPGSVQVSVDLARSFALDDDRLAMREFLVDAGFLHVRGVFSEGEMGAVARDMDLAAERYRPADGNSWWARCADGSHRVVRMQRFDQVSSIAGGFLEDPRLRHLAALTGSGHSPAALESNRLEALVKPLNVVEGMSDVPWHKDCSLGRHSYDCCSLTVGIYVTDADDDCGTLRMIAGSHRALTWPSMIDPGTLGLPEVKLTTRAGDVTLHLSCVLHRAEPPLLRERRVLYTSFPLPPFDLQTYRAAIERLDLIRGRASKPDPRQ